MIGKKMEAALNAQINAEYYSSYLYLAMSAYLEGEALSGMAHWMRLQSGEELEHVKKFYAYIVERGGRVTLDAIEAPPAKWKSAKAIFEEGYKHEQKVTALIHKLVDLAVAEKDYATQNFLQYFVKEQVEEEANALAIVEKFNMVGEGGTALYHLNKELGARQ